MDVTKPYKSIGLGAMDVTKPLKSIGFGAMEVTKPYRFMGSGAMADSGTLGPNFGVTGPRSGALNL